MSNESDPKTCFELKKIQHYKSKHSESLVPCIDNGCSQSFPNHSQMQQHYENEHVSQKFPCGGCGKQYRRKRDLYFHYDIHHPELVNRPFDFKCTHPDCSLVFSRIGHLNKHIERAHTKKKGKPGICPHCNRFFVFLHRHIRNVHEKRYQVFCQVCGDSFSMKRHLEYHLRHVHQQIVDSFHCNLCSRVFKSDRGLRDHKKRIHDGVRHQCPKCDKFVSSVASLKVHYAAVHKGIKVPCRFCSMEFHSKSGRLRHEKAFHSWSNKQAKGKMPREITDGEITAFH